MGDNKSSVDADGNHVARPKNSFFLYSEDMRPSLQGSGTEKARLIGPMWRKESAEVKAHYEQRAEAEKQKHAEKYPNYGYDPHKNKVAKVGNGGKRQPPKKKQLKPSLDMGKGHEVGVAQSAMPPTSLPYPMIPTPCADVTSPSTVSSPDSLRPFTPCDISAVLAAPFVPTFQSIPEASLNCATGHEVNGKGKGKERARDTFPMYNYQGTMAALPSHGRTSFLYNNTPTASISEPFPAASESAINYYSAVGNVETSDIAFAAAYQGANNILAKQPVQVNLNKQTAGDASVFRFGSGQSAYFRPVLSNSFVSSNSVDNTGVSNLNATVISSTPNPTKLYAAHYGSRKATVETVSNATSSHNNIVNTGVQNAQSLPVQFSSLPPSASINNSDMISEPIPPTSESAINYYSAVETPDITFAAAYQGANDFLAKQPVKVNLNKQTAGDASVFRFGSGQSAYFRPVLSNSFVPSNSVDNTGASNLNATVISSTPDPTKLYATHYGSRKATVETVGNGTSSHINIVNTGAQSLPQAAQFSSLHPSASINNSNMMSSSATVKHATPSPTELLSAHYASRGASAKRVTNDASRRASSEVTVSIDCVNPSVLTINSGASNFPATSRPVATIHSSTPISLLAAYNTVPQAPSNKVLEQPNNFSSEYEMEKVAAALVHDWFRGGLEEVDAQIAGIEEFLKEASVLEAQSAAPLASQAPRSLHFNSDNAYCGGLQTSIQVGGPSMVNASYPGPAPGPSFGKEFPGFNYANANF